MYGFSIGATALTFLAPLLGVLVGMTYCGLQDAYLGRLAKSHTFQPEQRLPFLIISCVAGTAGTILFGACTQDKCHWFIPLIGSFGSKPS